MKETVTAPSQAGGWISTCCFVPTIEGESMWAGSDEAQLV